MPTRDKPVCAVTRVVDGDTIEVVCRQGSAAVRLTGFDTPETFRPKCPQERMAGQRAKRALTGLLRNSKSAAIDYKGTGKYGRVLGKMYVDDVPLEQTMVSRGLAVAYDGGKRIDWCSRLGA